VGPVAVALGSNLGDRRAHLAFAIARLQTILTDCRVSTWYETVPAGTHVAQPMYLNAAAVGSTTLGARELLETLLDIEQERGRTRPHPNAARTLDLDLVLFGDAVISEPGLVVPHPRFRERRFVLEPLAEIAPDLVDPVTGASVRALLDDLERQT
jgi:2-amino-4-hydroxy-6-hydroxymethyldihydropteridine diphosphokinase